jgi:hypothetical protein
MKRELRKLVKQPFPWRIRRGSKLPSIAEQLEAMRKREKAKQ